MLALHQFISNQSKHLTLVIDFITCVIENMPIVVHMFDIHHHPVEQANEKELSLTNSKFKVLYICHEEQMETIIM